MGHELPTAEQEHMAGLHKGYDRVECNMCTEAQVRHEDLDGARALVVALEILGLTLHSRPREYQDKFSDALTVLRKRAGLDKNTELYPCVDCGKLRTKDEGGTVFTVCDRCWEKHHAK